MGVSLEVWRLRIGSFSQHGQARCRDNGRRHIGTDNVSLSVFVRLAMLLSLLVLVCGDIESNPGPNKERQQQQQIKAMITRQSKHTESAVPISTATCDPMPSPMNTQPSEPSNGSGDAIVLQLKSFINEKMSSLHQSLEDRFSILEEKAEQRAADLKEGLHGVEKELAKANCRIAELEAENLELRKKLDKMESQQDYTNGQLRRNNLIIHGIEQNENETWSDTEQKVRNFVNKELDIEDANVEIERAHRLTRAKTSPQPVVVKFNKYKDKDKIYQESRNLPRDSPYRVTEDLSPLVREKRRKLGPFLAAARQDNKRATMRYDKLIIEGEVFILDPHEKDPKLKKLNNR